MLSTDTTKSVLDTPPSIGIPSTLFSSTLRLSCLRCILVAGTVAMAFEIYWKAVPAAVVFGLIVLHHLLSAFGPRFIPLFIWLDLLLMLAELAYGIFAVIGFSAYVENYRWFPKRAVGGIFNIWLLTLMLAVLLCTKVIQLVDARGGTFCQRLDILRDRVSDGPGDDRLRRFSDGSSVSWWRYPVHVLFGRKIWERKLPGESFWIVFFRGLLAFIVILSLAIFGLFEIVLAPISEMGLTPNRVFRSEYLPLTFNSTTPIVWNLIVIWQKHSNAPQTLRESISLQPLWAVPAGKNSSEAPFGPECDVIEATQDMVPNFVNVNYFEVIIFHCPPRVPIPPDQAYSFHPLSYNRADTRPNLFLRANFTGLMAPRQYPNSRADMIWDSLKVYLALTNNTEHALLTTRPTPLFPGSNLVGVADLMVRQRLKSRELSTLGLFDLYDTFMIADIPYTVPEPRIGHPWLRNGTYPVGTNVSTLRIGCQSDPREWTVIQDYRDKSTLGGIAAVGGLGSFLSIFFIVCFGNSLLGIVYRTKPLTPFGIFHNLENEKARVSTSTIEKYSALRSDLQSLKDNPGLLAFMLDTLIDLDVVAEEHPHRMNYKQRLNAKLRDVEQKLSVEKQDSDSSGDEGEGLRKSVLKKTKEPFLKDDERQPWS